MMCVCIQRRENPKTKINWSDEGRCVSFFMVWFSCQRLNCGGVLIGRNVCSEDQKETTRRYREKWFHARKKWLVRVNSIRIIFHRFIFEGGSRRF